ncbi:MAG: hypothetical protein HYY06_20090 [Deltaproteobacteria bacterium]|nr:hypothetical protein [Deltaproteobacteria bacterium]
MGVQVPLLAQPLALGDRRFEVPLSTKWIIALATVALSACGGGSANGSFTPGPLPRGGDWTGVYFSDWGRMELTRTGDSVVGSFRGDAKSGHLSGTVNGNILRFTWQQDDNTIGGRPRTVTGGGVFQYVLDANGEAHLNGTWGYEAAVEGGGVWNATRGRGRPGMRRDPEDENVVDDGSDQSGGEEQVGQGSVEPAANPDALDDL